MDELRQYIADFRAFAGRRFGKAAWLVAFGALLEGFGILALLPFIAVMTGEPGGAMAQHLLDGFVSVGLATRAAQLIAITIVFLAILALRNYVIWRRETFLQELRLGFVDHWRERLFTAISRARWQAVAGLRRTDLEHAITADVNRLAAGNDRVLKAAAAVAMIAVQLGIVATLSPGLLAVTLALFALAGVFAVPLVRRAAALGLSLTKSGRRIHGVLGDFLVSQKLARLHNAQDGFLDRFNVAVAEVRAQQVEFTASQSAASGWFQFIAGTVVVGVLLVGFFVLDTPLPTLVVTLVVMARLAAPVQAVVQAVQATANMLPAVAALRETEAELIANSETERNIASASARAGRSGPADLALADIVFSHQGQARPLLDGVSLRIAPGETVALCGASGAGKTSLLDIVGGLWRPAGGTVRIDGRLLADPQDWIAWRDGIAFLPQDPFLFDTSLRDNLAWCAPDAGDDEIAEALRVVAADGIVAGLAHGLDTRAGERGQALSGGERQRICLAGALLRRPRLLILDEATNALDRALEDVILGRLTAMRDRFSILLVTHRSECLRHAERIYDLADGRAVERKPD
ncbi:MAG: ABC transporter ATP-binding protein [Sphingomonadales bacterium]|nr:ABC transporter ATP-binding protein [Sphingomonadales bacterium]